MFHKVAAALILALALGLGVKAYAFAGSLSGNAFDYNLMIGHIHTLYYNQTTCVGGPYSGRAAYQEYQTTSQWMRAPYRGGQLAKISVAHRNTGQWGKTCDGTSIKEYNGQETISTFAFNTYYNGYYWTNPNVKTFSGWHYLVQDVTEWPNGTCLYTHQTDINGNPGSYLLKTQFKLPGIGLQVDCN